MSLPILEAILFFFFVYSNTQFQRVVAAWYMLAVSCSDEIHTNSNRTLRMNTFEAKLQLNNKIQTEEYILYGCIRPAIQMETEIMQSLFCIRRLFCARSWKMETNELLFLCICAYSISFPWILLFNQFHRNRQMQILRYKYCFRFSSSSVLLEQRRMNAITSSNSIFHICSDLRDAITH